MAQYKSLSITLLALFCLTSFIGCTSKQIDSNLSTIEMTLSTSETTEMTTVKNTSATSKMNLTAIQNSDFSSIEGVWENAKGFQLEFNKDGLVNTDDIIDIKNSRIDKGILTANVTRTGLIGGYGMMFIPKHTELVSPDYTDPSTLDKDRILIGQSLYNNNKAEFFYKIK